ncbi:MAG TPA: histidine--tRNA ligase [Bacteroidia bacterium]|nr:histidine--tRNA ligase [Bacteroidia bacterium]QQR95851.1 MAG: histidine--tRNA ligase [Bacteroidota bacterium]MBP8669302.1 histidine--tRNA ligase [Bacteroidia bacterium]HOM91510.1 histidine--tRNA ligase [Bacteroidia bacterium]HQW16590.1 histidine--tRNA ligase [Bacteroidia bacterium]
MKPSIPKGTRDFSPSEMVRRNFIFNTIKKVYERYGFVQIETPAMENLSTLEGKYGEEGDKLLFRILNSGEVVQDSKSKGENLKISDLAEKGLRYDLTVPFARYVVMHQNEISFPFKRYQMQPVWRADRPQKGRYREFYQCDADVIGSTSLISEAEFLLIIQEVFSSLQIDVAIKINNRKILAGIAEVIGHADKIIDITVAIDKLDKIGEQKVKEELLAKGLSPDAVNKMQPLFESRGDFETKLNFLKTFLAESSIGLKGIEETENVISYLNAFGKQLKNLELDITLARGLNYYTGSIFEVKVNDSRSTFSGSVLGGGRYDDLTGIFGLPNVSGVGISFGIDRIYDVMLEMNLFDQLKLSETTSQVLLANFGREEEQFSLKILNELRQAGINAEIFPEYSAKMKKQMSYADSKKIPFVVLIGKDEMQSGSLTIKDMATGQQEKLTLSKIISKLSK